MVPKAKTEGMVSTPPFIDALDMKVLRNLIKTAKTVHDQELDRWGPRTPNHSTNEVPYDKRLSRKKKFQPKPDKGKGTDKGVILNSAKINDRREETEQYMRLCRGEELRPASVTSALTCRSGLLEDHNIKGTRSRSKRELDLNFLPVNELMISAG